MNSGIAGCCLFPALRVFVRVQRVIAVISSSICPGALFSRKKLLFLWVAWSCGGAFLSLQLCVAQDPKADPPLESLRTAPLPAGVIARVNGRDIPVEDYVGYLFASLGKSRLDEFLDRLLLEEEAKSSGVSIAQDRVEAAMEEKIERTIKGLYQGSRKAFLDSLSKRRSSLEEHKAKLRQDIYYESLASELVLRTRQVTEPELRKQFEKSHGEGGVRNVIRHILITSRTGIDPAKPDGGGRPIADARERAEKVLKELQAGGDFVQAVKQYSDDAFTKKNEGRIPLYQKGFYGDAFHNAVMQLTPEKPLSGIVESPKGYHLIQLVERQATRFEDVQAELEKQIRTQTSTALERRMLLERLRVKAKIEGL